MYPLTQVIGNPVSFFWMAHTKSTAMENIHRNTNYLPRQLTSKSWLFSFHQIYDDLFKVWTLRPLSAIRSRLFWQEIYSFLRQFKVNNSANYVHRIPHGTYSIFTTVFVQQAFVIIPTILNWLNIFVTFTITRMNILYSRSRFVAAPIWKHAKIHFLCVFYD